MQERQSRRWRSSLQWVLYAILLASLIGCTGWQKKATAGYVGGAAGLAITKEVAVSLCKDGVIKEDKCTQLKTIYNKTIDAYIVSGDVLKIAIKTDDVIQRKSYLAEYKKLLVEYEKLAKDLWTLAIELGISDAILKKVNLLEKGGK